VSEGEIIVRDVAGLSQLQPQNVKELAWFAQEASASGLFTITETGNRKRPLNGKECFLLMSQGVELGLSPLQSLRELNIINGRVDIPASVRAAKIASSPKVTLWDVESDDTHCIIKAKRRDRDNSVTVEIKLESMSQGDKTRHASHLADWLYSRAVRRISRQYFPDMNLGMGQEQEFERTVVDVAAIEQASGLAQSVGACEKCGGAAYLRPNKSGGVYAQCEKCGYRQAPPQAVRDTVRGRMDDFAEQLPDATVIGEDGRDPTPEELEELNEPGGSDTGADGVPTGVEGTDGGEEVSGSDVPDALLGPGEGDGGDASSPDDAGAAAYRARLTDQLLAQLKAHMVDGAPHQDHVFVMSTHGWDKRTKVSKWLEALPVEVLEVLVTVEPHD
jgi:hypothetical protein